MKEVRRHTELTVPLIKELYTGLKKQRKVLNWGEFADQINKDRTYISRIINKHEPLTDTVRHAIFERFMNTTGNVVEEAAEDYKKPPETKTPPPGDRTEELINILKEDRSVLQEQAKTLNLLIIANLNKLLDLQQNLSETSKNTLGLLKTTASHIAAIEAMASGRTVDEIKAEINKATLNEVSGGMDIPVSINGKG